MPLLEGGAVSPLTCENMGIYWLKVPNILTARGGDFLGSKIGGPLTWLYRPWNGSRNGSTFSPVEIWNIMCVLPMCKATCFVIYMPFHGLLLIHQVSFYCTITSAWVQFISEMWNSVPRVLYDILSDGARVGLSIALIVLSCAKYVTLDHHKHPAMRQLQLV